MSNKIDEIRVIVDDDNLAAIVCPECGYLIIEDVSRQLSGGKSVRTETRCRCGHAYAVFLERRQSFRKSTRLSGIYGKFHDNMPMTVLDLSRSGLKFHIEGRHDLRVGDCLYIEFALDDRDNSHVLRKVDVKSVNGPVIGAEFSIAEKPTAVTNYIYFTKGGISAGGDDGERQGESSDPKEPGRTPGR